MWSITAGSQVWRVLHKLPSMVSKTTYQVRSQPHRRLVASKPSTTLLQFRKRGQHWHHYQDGSHINRTQRHLTFCKARLRKLTKVNTPSRLQRLLPTIATSQALTTLLWTSLIPVKLQRSVRSLLGRYTSKFQDYKIVLLSINWLLLQMLHAPWSLQLRHQQTT